MKQLEEYTVQFGWDEYGSFAHKKKTGSYIGAVASFREANMIFYFWAQSFKNRIFKDSQQASLKQMSCKTLKIIHLSM